MVLITGFCVFQYYTFLQDSKQEAGRPNRLRCIIESTQVSTYGFNILYTRKSVQYAPTYIGFKTRYGSHGTFWAPPGPLGAKWPRTSIYRAKGLPYSFRIMKPSPVVSKTRPGPNLVPLGLLSWSHRVPGPIFYTFLKVSTPIELNNKFPVNPIETFFAKPTKTLMFNILAIFKNKTALKTSLRGPIFNIILKEVTMNLKIPVSCKSSETCCKKDKILNFYLILALLGVKKGTKTIASGAHIPHTSKSSYSKLKTSFMCIQWKPFAK